MRMLAEETKTGTLELLLTKSVSDRQLVMGKFIASLLLICIALVATLPYIITIANIGNLDNGGTICGYLALFLMVWFILQLEFLQVALLLLNCSLYGGFNDRAIFHIIFDVLAGNFTGFIGNLFIF